MDVETLSGEEIATLINGEYQKLMTAQQNLQVLNIELTKRVEAKKTVKEEAVNAVTKKMQVEAVKKK